MNDFTKTSPCTAAARPSFRATRMATTAPRYMSWPGGIATVLCTIDHKVKVRNHFGTNGSKRTTPDHLVGGLT